MRVNPDIMPDLLAVLGQAQQEQRTALLQLGSGRRVNKPSDDPAAAAMVVQNQARAAQTDEFLHSVDSVRAVLATADSTLNSVVLRLERAISLGVQGANGTLSVSNRLGVAQEVIGVQDQLLSLANLSFNGSYVFAGTATQSQPFVLDSASPSGVRYDGNAGTNLVEIGQGLTMQINQPGSVVFAGGGADVFQAMYDLVSALQTGSGIEAAVSGVRQAFDHVVEQRVFYGNAINQLDAQQQSLQGERLELNRQQNNLVGADPAATASNLANAQTARDAVLKAAGQISQLSLFDFLT